MSNPISNTSQTQKNKLPHIYSYSQLGSYRDCSYKFEQYYIKKNRKRDVTEATQAGTLVHTCIEEFYQGKHPSAHEAFDPVISTYLEDLKILDWKPELDAISDVIKNLLVRSSASYIGSDAIRTKGGDVPKNPEMTSDWKQSLIKNDLVRRIADANEYISKRLPPEWENVKMVNIYSTVDHITKIYTHPTAIKSVDAIEFSFTVPVFNVDINDPDPAKRFPYIDNPVTLPSGKLFRGFIDLVGTGWDGGRLIIDHKTSNGEPPSETKVHFHEQLLLYAFFWHQLTGEWPKKIGISHLRSGTLVLSDLDPKLALAAANRHDEVIKAIDNKVFLKHAPFEYGSPCLGRSGGLEGSCAYFTECHKEVAIALGWEDPEDPVNLAKKLQEQAESSLESYLDSEIQTKPDSY